MGCSNHSSQSRPIGHSRVLGIPAHQLPVSPPRIVVTDNALMPVQTPQGWNKPHRAIAHSVPKALLPCSDHLTPPTNGLMTNTNLTADWPCGAHFSFCPAVTLWLQGGGTYRHTQHDWNGAWDQHMWRRSLSYSSLTLPTHEVGHLVGTEGVQHPQAWMPCRLNNSAHEHPKGGEGPKPVSWAVNTHTAHP